MLLKERKHLLPPSPSTCTQNEMVPFVDTLYFALPIINIRSGNCNLFPQLSFFLQQDVININVNVSKSELERPLQTVYQQYPRVHDTTTMHSKRMRTVRSSGYLSRGGVCSGGCLLPGSLLRGVVSQHALRQTLTPSVDRQMPVKT